MSFNQHSPLSELHPSRYDWSIRVRAQSIWESRSKEKNEFRGFNVIFIDDSVSTTNHFFGLTPSVMLPFQYLYIYCCCRMLGYMPSLLQTSPTTIRTLFKKELFTEFIISLSKDTMEMKLTVQCGIQSTFISTMIQNLLKIMGLD